MAVTGQKLRNRVANLKNEAEARLRRAQIKDRLAASLSMTPEQESPIPHRAHQANSRTLSRHQKEAQMATPHPRLSERNQLRDRIAAKQATPLTEERKAEIRARLAAKRASSNVQGVKQAAQTRVAAAWTLAKFMLPKSATSEQMKMANTLLALDTPMLATAVRKAAKEAANTKMAEELKDVHKIELNDLMENESVLNKLKNELAKEMKTASDKECGSEGCDKKKEEPKKEEVKDEKKASVKKADDEEKKEEPKAEEAPAEDAPADEAPAGDEEGLDFELNDEEGGEESTEVTDDTVVEEVEDLKGRVQEAEASINQLEEEIAEIDGEELDLGDIFNEDVAEDKRQSLANEGEEVDGDEKAAAVSESEITEEEDFFGPTDTMDMSDMVEGGMDVDITEPADFFTQKASVKSAKEVAGTPTRKSNAERRAALIDEVVEPGELADEFESELAGGDDRDFESDHEDDILSEVFEKLEQNTFEQDDYHTEPEFEKAAAKAAASRAARVPVKHQANAAARAKAASTLGVSKPASRKTAAPAGKKPVMTIEPRPAAPKTAALSERDSIARLVFGDDEF